jgi:hypothetical protein
MAPSAAISPSHRRGCERDFESAKLNGLDPQHYLADALARIRRPSPPAALRNSDLELANAGLDIVWPQLAALAAKLRAASVAVASSRLP